MKLAPQFIKACLQRDEQSCKELFFMCYNTLMNISIRYQYNEADAKEAVNHSYLKILDGLNTYKSAESFKSWISKICVNTNIDFYRKHKRINDREELCDEFKESYLLNSKVTNIAKEELDAEHLHHFITALPRTSKEVFMLYAIDGYAHNEISELLGISPTSSRWHVSEARKRLKLMIENQSQPSKVSDYEKG